jgi:hypothetical protein
VSYHVEYFIPGILMPETTTRRLECFPGDRVRVATKEAPERAFCFVLYELPDDVPPSTDEYRVTPKRRNVTARYYLPPCTVWTAEQLEMRNAEEFGILISNMRGNGWERVVECRTHNWQPLMEGDVVL